MNHYPGRQFGARIISPLAIFLMISNHALAQISSTEATKPLPSREAGGSNTSRISSPIASQVSVGLGHESLLSGQTSSNISRDDNRVTVLGLLRESRLPGASGALRVRASVPTGVGRESMFEVPEAYAIWRAAFEEGVVAAIGRKHEIWSSLDSDWGLGLWQPRHRFDGLRTTEQGLPGLFLGTQTSLVEILVFASPVFLPDQGPSFDLHEGTFETSNPWFSEPADHVILFSKQTKTHYELDKPSTSQVLSHAQGGLKIRMGARPESDGFSIQSAYTRKPRNQLALPFDGYLDIGRNEARVMIKPTVEYHDLASIDAAVRSGEARFGFGILADLSPGEMPPNGYTGQVLEPLYIFSPKIEARVFPARYWGPILRVSSLHSIGGEARTRGPLAGDSNPYAARVIFREAVSLEVRSRLWRKQNFAVEQSVRWIEELWEHASVGMFDFSLTHRRGWRLSAYADVLASRQPSDENPGFISRFRSNDRIGTQLSYWF